MLAISKNQRRGDGLSSKTDILDPNLPEIITCGICRDPRLQSDYSTAQLAALNKALDSRGLKVLVNQKVAKCIDCSGSPNLEYKCRFCNEWKEIEFFARNQRLLLEPACKDCQDSCQESAQPGPANTSRKMIEGRPLTKAELPDEALTLMVSQMSIAQPSDPKVLIPGKNVAEYVRDQQGEEGFATTPIRIDTLDQCTALKRRGISDEEKMAIFQFQRKIWDEGNEKHGKKMALKQRLLENPEFALESEFTSEEESAAPDPDAFRRVQGYRPVERERPQSAPPAPAPAPDSPIEGVMDTWEWL
ncbi:meiotic chromosome segregation protein P8B7.28c [Penicillium odoratum]|uniref:meiotic chromosome segregation protein P8B7.28c n=1 Tax=Penicillium odoratum TaxID=1167516 RepID=UPI0025496650|nr:meiotic chromosome segregation protein P8B7.28c [Penicillium odoratum]KAJ5759555.1 meiotic chromosome segregation protein P8B7.28c [Penicillium odoratum]